MKKGIDVSSHQGTINWAEVKNNIDFAIIRLGYGDDDASQDDTKFFDNVNGCINNGIPFGVYIYSYATNLGGNASIQSEINHCKRLLSQVSKKPFCVYIDMEDDSTKKLGKTLLTDFALEFCKQITVCGYKAGVYANQNWFINYLDPNIIKEQGYSLWVAKYSSDKPAINCDYDIWQYSDSGRMSGISDNCVDLNYMIKDIIDDKPTPTPQSLNHDIIYQVWDDVRNSWLPNVVNNSDYAGIFGHDVCCVYANINNGNVWYRVHYKGGSWLPIVRNREDYAGIFNKPIDGFMIMSDARPLTYRVHLRRQNKWLGWVTGYNINDAINGYGGILGKEIDAIEIK